MMVDPGRILITGGSGFVGRHVQGLLHEAGRSFVSTSRRSLPECINVGEMGPNTEWRRALVDIRIVVHLAGRVHVVSENAADPVTAFRTTNVVGTERLAKMAADAGARRLVFLSTVGIVGSSSAGTVDERTKPEPTGAYAMSKLEAEEKLMTVAEKSELEVTILRAPLVYGRGAPGSLVRLRSLVERGIPLPLGMVENVRSAIAVENLASALLAATGSRGAANRVLYVEDGTLWSSRQMTEQIGKTIGRQPRMIPVPVAMLRAALNLARQGELANRLLGSLAIDSSAFRLATGWVPPVAVDDALDRGVV